MNLTRRIRLGAIAEPLKQAWTRHKDYVRIRSELAAHSARELAADLRISLSDIDEIARRAGAR